ncbi:MAG: GyrI-like domain-containing protein [Spirochaetaceae bacterium]|jgi:hypothetical protein|nr:GyrI-like domain-containing protein [Spirochaetaceae bacterium]
MDVYDFKKEEKALYMPSGKPALIEVPEMSFVAVDGKGDPNEANGEYSAAITLLYNIQYTIKMSKKGDSQPPAYFDYVVPPLEGLWWFTGSLHEMPKDKSLFCWTSLIRLPDFVTNDVFDWACREAARKKKIDTQKAKRITFTEGLCVQCMHTGPFDDEAKTTMPLIHQFITENGMALDINDMRHHHEIYLSDPRKTTAEKMKTVLRVPVGYR